VASGRKRGNLQRRSLLRHHTLEQTTAGSEAPSVPEADEADDADWASTADRDGVAGGGKPVVPDTQTSLDEVLRHAAEVREQHEGSEPSDRGG